MTKNMTQGKPLRVILSFMVPMLLGNLFQQFYNIADTVIVGRFVGVQALAAVGSTGSLNFVIIGFVMGMSSGFCIPVAHYFGAEDMQGVRRCITHQVYLTVIITVVLTAVTVLLTRPMLVLMQTPADIMEEAYGYIRIIFAGIFAIAFYNMLANISRALGDSRTPLYFLLVASVLNVVLDLVFILAFHMGAAGAAYATVLAQLVAGIFCLFYMGNRFPILRFRKDDWKLEPWIIGRLLANGFPMALQFSITGIGSIILQSAINSFGSGVVAAVTAASKVQMILVQPLEAMGPTMATYCSQNLGAGRLDRISKGVQQSLLFSLGASVLCFLAAGFWGPAICKLFISSREVEIFHYVSIYLWKSGAFYWMLAILLVLRNSIQGMGFALPAMAAGVCELVARGMAGALLVGVMGFDAICFASPIAWLLANALLIPVFLYAIRLLRHRQAAHAAIGVQAGSAPPPAAG